MSRDETHRLALPVSEERDHVQGAKGATLTLVEYGDFECPHCGRAHRIMKDVAKALGPELRFVFRHFPLATAHPHATRAAEAAECAAAQDAFWPMHDRIFENQEALEDDDLVAHAEALGLDVARFEKELREGSHAKRVREDFLSGARSGVNGTPTFFVDGRRHDGAWDAESLVSALREALAEERRRVA